MCRVQLNVSLLECRHRWYHLTDPCNTGSNLRICGSRLSISGWEIKCDFCPFCERWASQEEYRLIGNDMIPAVGGIARSPSLSLAVTRRESRSRRGSIARSDSSTSITALNSEKNKAMTERVNAYFGRAPRPEMSSKPAPLQEFDDENDGVDRSPSDTSSECQGSIRQASYSSQGGSPGLLNKMRRKSKKVSLMMFK